MQPKHATEFYRARYSKPSTFDDGKPCLAFCEKDDPEATRVEFEIDRYCTIDFDLDARPVGEMAHRVQGYRVENFERFLMKVFEAGVGEGTRRVRETLREVVGL